MYVHFELPDVEWRNGEILYSKVFLQQLSLKDGRMESIAENIESFPDTSSLLYYHEYGLYRIWAQCFNEAGGSPLSEVAFLDLEYDPNSTWFIKNFNCKFLRYLIWTFGRLDVDMRVFHALAT